MNIDDFEKILFLGKGAFSRVVLMKHKETGKMYAMKIILESLIKEDNMKKQIIKERDVLMSLNHPNIIRLHFYFHVEDELFFGLEHAPNGALSRLLKIDRKSVV